MRREHDICVPNMAKEFETAVYKFFPPVSIAQHGHTSQGYLIKDINGKIEVKGVLSQKVYFPYDEANDGKIEKFVAEGEVMPEASSGDRVAVHTHGIQNGTLGDIPFAWTRKGGKH